MGKPTTLLEGLCGHALSLGSQSIAIEYKDHCEWVFVNKDGEGIRVAHYACTSSDAQELRANLYAAKKPVRTVLNGKVCILKVRVFPFCSRCQIKSVRFTRWEGSGFRG
jgi:hypothetical protein